MNSNQTHTVAFLKRQAKKLKKAKGVPHTVALEMIAKEHNYASWRHVLNSQNNPPLSHVTVTTKAGAIPFTQWLARHRKRNSPLGDLAKDAATDNAWPDASDVETYRNHLWNFNASDGAVAALNRAWNSYQSFLKRSSLPANKKRAKRKGSDSAKPAKRRITFVKNVKPLNYSQRVAEKFSVGDKAWVCFGGSKALPAIVIEVDDRHYTVKFERSSKRPRITLHSQNSLFHDEVRSTPELACINCVTS